MGRLGEAEGRGPTRKNSSCTLHRWRSLAASRRSCSDRRCGRRRGRARRRPWSRCRSPWGCRTSRGTRPCSRHAPQSQRVTLSAVVSALSALLAGGGARVARGSVDRIARRIHLAVRRLLARQEAARLALSAVDAEAVRALERRGARRRAHVAYAAQAAALLVGRAEHPGLVRGGLIRPTRGLGGIARAGGASVAGDSHDVRGGRAHGDQAERSGDEGERREPEGSQGRGRKRTSDLAPGSRRKGKTMAASHDRDRRARRSGCRRTEPVARIPVPVRALLSPGAPAPPCV